MTRILTGAFYTLGLLSSLVGCMSASPPSKAAAPGPPTSAVMFPAINVLDLKATEAFYVEIMGMKPTLRIGDEGSEHQEVTLNFTGVMSSPETSLVLNYLASRTEPYVNDALSRIAFRVPDVEDVVERVRAAGHTILSEPRMIEVKGTGIKLAFVQDPNGTRVELIQPMGPSGASR